MVAQPAYRHDPGLALSLEMTNSPSAMADTTVVPSNAAEEVRAPGSSLGVTAEVPTSPGDAKRGRQGDHDPGKPLFALAAIQARQDTTNDVVAKLKSENT